MFNNSWELEEIMWIKLNKEGTKSQNILSLLFKYKLLQRILEPIYTVILNYYSILDTV